jgi:hypothetical protein
LEESVEPTTADMDIRDEQFTDGSEEQISTNTGGEEFVQDNQPGEWYFTFGEDHIEPISGKSMGKEFVALRGTFMGTRKEMMRRFGDRWAGQYASRDVVDRFELHETRLEHDQEAYM